MRENLGDIAWSCGQFFLLAPSGEVPEGFRNAKHDPRLHRDLLAKLQRLRGEAYLDDGAIDRRQVTEDGRHVVASDERSWHAVAVDDNGEVRACIRHLLHSNRTRFDDLELKGSALARSEEWGARLAAAVRAELNRMRVAGLAAAEVGGWALAESCRRSALAARLPLLSYAVCRAIGAGLALGTATVRHNSATILRRVGGRSLESNGESLPSYFDAAYGCWMEILRFDIGQPPAKYRDWVDFLSRQLCSVPVICPDVAPAPAEELLTPWSRPLLWDVAPAIG